MKRLLVIQVAGLGADFAESSGLSSVCGIDLFPADGIFPGLTCTVQSGFRTGLDVAGHGMPGNGYFDRSLRRVFFWEQSSSLVEGGRIWDGFAASGGRTAMLFWQQSLGESVDIVMSPAPVHRHHGGIIENTYCKPAGLYSQLSSAAGSAFRLKDYWGPVASVRASEWIAQATAALISCGSDAPDLCFTYLPALDYDLQRYGPVSRQAYRAADALRKQLKLLISSAAAMGMEVVVFGDYAIAPVNSAVLPNLCLAQAGMLKLNSVKGMLYPDFHESRAFCVVDHEIGHIYLKNAGDAGAVKDLLLGVEGISSVNEAAGCARSGDLMVSAADGKWLAYPWWEDSSEAPEYASHVDIHSKPGYDPCELFFGWPPFRTSMDTGRVRGSHGKTGPGRRVAAGSTAGIAVSAGSVLELAGQVKAWLNGG